MSFEHMCNLPPARYDEDVVISRTSGWFTHVGGLCHCHFIGWQKKLFDQRWPEEQLKNYQTYYSFSQEKKYEWDGYKIA